MTPKNLLTSWRTTCTCLLSSDIRRESAGHHRHEGYAAMLRILEQHTLQLMFRLDHLLGLPESGASQCCRVSGSVGRVVLDEALCEFDGPRAEHHFPLRLQSRSLGHRPRSCWCRMLSSLCLELGGLLQEGRSVLQRRRRKRNKLIESFRGALHGAVAAPKAACRTSPCHQ